MKYTHYAPRAPVYIVNGSVDKMRQLAEELVGKGERVSEYVCVY